jgi:hypothetical protein
VRAALWGQEAGNTCAESWPGRVEIDAAALPYRADALLALRREASGGARVILAGGGFESSRRMAGHLGICLACRRKSRFHAYYSFFWHLRRTGTPLSTGKGNLGNICKLRPILRKLPQESHQNRKCLKPIKNENNCRSFG